MFKREARYLHSLLLALLFVVATTASASHVHGIDFSESERFESCGAFHATPLDQAYAPEGPSLYFLAPQFQITNYTYLSVFSLAEYKPSPRAPPTFS